MPLYIGLTDGSTRLSPSLVPRPSTKSGKRVWCSERLFLSHGAGSNGVINVIIAFPHTLDAACKMIRSCAICTIALPVTVQQRRSLDPASASNKTVVEYLATVSPELELANGSLCKACFTKLKKAATFLATAENITNELREKFAFGL